MRKNGLLWIPKTIWPVVQKCARNRGYEYPKGRHKDSHVIFMSGAPLAVISDIIGMIKKGEIKAVLIPTVGQPSWTEYNKKERVLTVQCPKYGKICAVGRNCVAHKRRKGYRGAIRVMPECEYFVKLDTRGVLCLHPQAADFAERIPWKNPEGVDGLPLFEHALEEVTHEDPVGC